jgi:hypothetical protein
MIFLIDLGVILVGINTGFSAIAIPDIMEEYARAAADNFTTTTFLPPIQADMDQLSWFGKARQNRKILLGFRMKGKCRLYRIK